MGTPSLWIRQVVFINAGLTWIMDTVNIEENPDCCHIDIIVGSSAEDGRP